MYEAKKQPTPLTQYTEILVSRGTVTENRHQKWVWEMLEQAAGAPKDYVPTCKEWLSAAWQGFPSPKELAERTLATRSTGSDIDTLKRIATAISSYPPGFTLHRNLA